MHNKIRTVPVIVWWWTRRATHQSSKIRQFYFLWVWQSFLYRLELRISVDSKKFQRIEFSRQKISDAFDESDEAQKRRLTVNCRK